jgi:hypothetical protein
MKEENNTNERPVLVSGMDFSVELAILEFELQTLQEAESFLYEAKYDDKLKDCFGKDDGSTLCRALELIKECLEICERKEYREDLSVNLDKVIRTLNIYALAKKAIPAKHQKDFDTVALDISERLLKLKEAAESIIKEEAVSDKVAEGIKLQI